MSVGGLGVAFVILSLFVLWLLLPFVWGTPDDTPDAVIGKQHERLQMYYERVLRNIHDLDEDYGTGKLNAEDYHQNREQWVQRGMQALQAMDTLNAQALELPKEADDASIDSAIENRIEQRMASGLADKSEANINEANIREL